MSERQIYAAYDDEGVYVYQAFKPSIVKAALDKGTFGAGFNMERMTWIKPSFGWILYRSGYATKTRQEAILKIKLTHEGFLKILRRHRQGKHFRQVRCRLRYGLLHLSAYQRETSAYRIDKP